MIILPLLRPIIAKSILGYKFEQALFFVQYAPNLARRVVGSLVKSNINPFLNQGGICWFLIQNKLICFIQLDFISFACHLALLICKLADYLWVVDHLIKPSTQGLASCGLHYPRVFGFLNFFSTPKDNDRLNLLMTQTCWAFCPMSLTYRVWIWLWRELSKFFHT